MKNLYLLAILVWSGIQVHAARHEYSSAYYNQLAGKSAKYLTDKAYTFLSDEDKRDSALIYYSILANKYYDEKQNTADRYRSISAMNDLGYMYYFYYFDYQKAFNYYKQTQDLAEKENNERVKPLLYLNIANLYRTFDEMNGASGFGPRAFEYYKMSFAAAHSRHNLPQGLSSPTCRTHRTKILEYVAYPKGSVWQKLQLFAERIPHPRSLSPTQQHREIWALHHRRNCYKCRIQVALQLRHRIQEPCRNATIRLPKDSKTD